MLWLLNLNFGPQNNWKSNQKREFCGCSQHTCYLFTHKTCATNSINFTFLWTSKAILCARLGDYILIWRSETSRIVSQRMHDGLCGLVVTSAMPLSRSRYSCHSYALVVVVVCYRVEIQSEVEWLVTVNSVNRTLLTRSTSQPRDKQKVTHIKSNMIEITVKTY